MCVYKILFKIILNIQFYKKSMNNGLIGLYIILIKEDGVVGET